MLTWLRAGVAGLVLVMWLGGGRAWAELAPIACSQEGTARSPITTAASTILFINNGSTPVQTFWLDFNG